MIKAQIAGIVLLVMMALSAAGTWFVTSNHYEKEMAVAKAAQAEHDRAVTVAAFADLTGQMKAVHEAATNAVNVLADTNGRLDNIGKGFKNAKPAKPLPTGCKPDALRVQSLDAAIDAVNAAAARRGTGG